MQKSQDMHSLNIPLGTAITCLLNKTEKVETRLVGLEESSFILLKFPALTGIRNYLQERRPFAAHFSMGSSSIFFTSVIDTVVERRFLALCQYPPVFKVFDLRSGKRVECLVPAGVMVNDCYYYGVIKDISSGGCHLVLDAVHGSDLRKIAPGDGLSLEFGQQHRTIIVTGSVMHVRKSLSRTTLGVAFSNLDAKDSSLITGYIQDLMCSAV